MPYRKEMESFLPHAINYRITKLDQARDGGAIYKRRNNRSTRVIIHYPTWNRLIEHDPDNILEQYEAGYAVLLKPEQYFGKCYPDRDDDLNSEIELGKNAFVYYNTKNEYDNYKPLECWHEVYELSYDKKQGETPSWIGDYALNIANTTPPLISNICKKSNNAPSKKEISDIIERYLEKNDIDFETEKFPQQRGFGNYDFDYANSEMQTAVGNQVLSLILQTKTRDGKNFAELLSSDPEMFTPHKSDKNLLEKIESPDFIKDFEYILEKFLESNKDVLDYDLLHKIGAWDKNRNCVVCPLCYQEIYAEDFFAEILQQEGRRSADNTQREIVLMHIDALAPGKLNHRTYNLGWGHNLCNTIQGDRDISQTIEDLRNIVNSYDMHTRQ